MGLQVCGRFSEIVATSCSSSPLWTGEQEVWLQQQTEGVYMEEFLDPGTGWNRGKKKSRPFF